MQYLNRNKLYEKRQPAKDAKKIYIFCEGSVREVVYFSYFKGLSSNIDIYPIPSKDGKSDPVKLKENADILFFGETPIHILSKEYGDEVWFVIDTDTWDVQGKIDVLRNYCDERNHESLSWKVAQSNPCFEMWLFYHIINLKPKHTDVIEYKSFKDFVNAKVVGGVDVRKVPLLLEDAIRNSKDNFSKNEHKPLIYSTEMHLLGEIILYFVKDQLVKALKIHQG